MLKIMAGLAQVLVGNLVINPEVLREFLKKSDYFMHYEKNKDLLTFSVNDGNGGQVIFEIRNVSHESALKLAEGLGLKANDRDPQTACFWSKWNPVYKLIHDGSQDAEEIRIEALRLGLPLRVRYTSGAKDWTFYDDRYQYDPKSWGKERLFQTMKEQAERYKDTLSAVP